MSRRRPLDLQRLHHVDGEMLRSRDFRDAVAGDLELHWWHQRAVHEAYGVASGLGVEDAGDDALTVDAGLAYDARGRELVLAAPATVGVPESRERLALVLRRRHEGLGATVAWIPARRVDPCAAVTLAVFDRRREKRPRVVGVRARSVARPHIGWGATQPDATAWWPWEGVQRRFLARGVQVAIDTRAAGFTDVPCYFAWLQWPNLAAAPADGAVEPQILGLQYVRDEAVEGFTFSALVSRSARLFEGLSGGDGVGDPVSFARAQQLYVCWLGIQCDDAARGA